jgi:hypothetical protein
MLYYLPSKVETVENQLGQSLGSALKEISLHGREKFEQYKKIVDDIAQKYNVNVTNGDKGYEYYVVKWARDSGSRHSEYRSRSKPYLNELCEQGLISENDQKKIFGRVIKELYEEDSEYTGHSAECVCEYILDTRSIYILSVALVFLSLSLLQRVRYVYVRNDDPLEYSTITYTGQSNLVEVDNMQLVFNCCKGSVCCRKPRRDEEEVESIPSSSDSGSTVKANNLINVENDGRSTNPAEDERTPSLFYRSLCCDFGGILYTINYICGRHVEY